MFSLGLSCDAQPLLQTRLWQLNDIDLVTVFTYAEMYHPKRRILSIDAVIILYLWRKLATKILGSLNPVLI